jgi:hypothetical protein
MRAINRLFRNQGTTTPWSPRRWGRRAGPTAVKREQLLVGFRSEQGEPR